MIPDELSGLFTRKRDVVLAKCEEVSAALHELSSSFQSLPASSPADQPRALQAARDNLNDFRAGVWADFKKLFPRPDRRTAGALRKGEAALEMEDSQLAVAIKAGGCEHWSRVGFETAQSALWEIKEAQQRGQILFKAILCLVWATPVILGYLIAVYYRVSPGLQVTETFVAAPALGFGRDGAGVFAMNERYRREWFYHFSRYYFGREPWDPDTVLGGGNNDNRDALLFKATDFPDVSAAVKKMTEPFIDGDNNSWKYLWDQIPSQTQQVLKDPQSPVKQKAEALADAFNQILKKNWSIYASGIFSNLRLRWETRNLLFRKPGGEDLLWLKRLLIEDACRGQVVELPEDHVTQMQFDTVLQNSARAGPMTLGSLVSRLSLSKKREFPWKLVDTSVQVVGDEKFQATVTLTNIGVGLLRNLSYQGTVQAGVLYEMKQKMTREPLPDFVSIDLSEPKLSEDGAIAMSSLPVYRKLDESEHPPDKKDKAYFEIKAGDYGVPGQYEEIGTLDRLEDVTRVYKDRTVHFHFSYQSLRRDTQTGEFCAAIPHACYVYETKARNGNLSGVDPRGRGGRFAVAEIFHTDPIRVAVAGPIRVAMMGYAASGTFDMAAIMNLADMWLPASDSIFAPASDSTSPVGDLMVQHFTISAGGLNEGDDRTVAATPEKALNPGGLLLMGVSVADLATGDYTLDLYGNGRELLSKPVTFSAVASPHWHFRPEDVLFFDPKYGEGGSK